MCDSADLFAGKAMPRRSAICAPSWRSITLSMSKHGNTFSSGRLYVETEKKISKCPNDFQTNQCFLRHSHSNQKPKSPSTPRLVKFVGRPSDLSPKARFRSWIGYVCGLYGLHLGTPLPIVLLLLQLHIAVRPP